MLKADGCGHNSLRSNEVSQLSAAILLRAKGSSSRNQAVRARSLPPLCIGMGGLFLPGRAKGADVWNVWGDEGMIDDFCTVKDVSSRGIKSDGGM